MDPLLPDDPPRVGRFELVGRLGSGGMGQVYLGRAPDGTPAAVKLVHESHAGDPRFRVRFAREVSTARRVRAPWAAALLDADPDAPRPWLATQYVLGPSLERQVITDGVLGGEPLYVLAGRLAVALAELHAIGVVHRDLKPSNVLLAADGPRLIDFGIARALGASKITDTGEVIGTPGYMSPEQASGEDGGPPSDVFSLASVLVFAASGQGPFGLTASPVAMLLRVVQGAPDLAELPDDLRLALEPCLAKEPTARPTAARLAEGLAAKAHRPTHWPPPSTLPTVAVSTVAVSRTPRPTPTLVAKPAAPTRTATPTPTLVATTPIPTLVAPAAPWAAGAPLAPAAPGWSPPRSPPPGTAAPVHRTRRRAALGTAVVLAALLVAGVGYAHRPASPAAPTQPAAPGQPSQTQPPPSQPPPPNEPPSRQPPANPAELTPLPVTREPKADAHPDLAGLAVTRDGGRLLVTSGGRLEVLDATSHTLLDGVAVDGATQVVAARDGSRAFVATDSGVAAVNLATKKIEYTVGTLGPVDQMVISADGSRVVAVGGSRGGGPVGVTVLNTATWAGGVPPRRRATRRRAGCGG